MRLGCASARTKVGPGSSRRIRAPLLLSPVPVPASATDILAALELQPDNPEASALMTQHVADLGKVRGPFSPQGAERYSSMYPYLSLTNVHVMPTSQPLVQPHTTPGFSTEIWREIALWLPPRDLKSLLQVPHVLSRIASELLFQRIDLHLGRLATGT